MQWTEKTLHKMSYTIACMGLRCSHISCWTFCWFPAQIKFIMLWSNWDGSALVPAESRENVPTTMRKMCAFTSSYPCAKSHPGIFYPLKHYIVANYSDCGQRMPWSDCAGAQSDLGLRSPHMPAGAFSHSEGRIILFLVVAGITIDFLNVEKA